MITGWGLRARESPRQQSARVSHAVSALGMRDGVTATIVGLVCAGSARSLPRSVRVSGDSRAHLASAVVAGRD